MSFKGFPLYCLGISLFYGFGYEAGYKNGRYECYKSLNYIPTIDKPDKPDKN